MPDRSAEEEMGDYELPTGSHVGRVGLRVGSLDRLASFYETVVGLPARRDRSRAVLGPTADEPLVVLEEDPGAPERPREAAGLFHLAIRAPNRSVLGDAVTRLRRSEATLGGASDHLVSEALYLRDPEGNGVELYRDRPRDAWPEVEDGLVGMETHPLDLDDLESSGDGDHVDSLPPDTDVGHVHLEVSNLAQAETFYRDVLGLRLRARYGTSAAFLATDDYHHHLGLNVWNGRSAPVGDHRGLAWWELVVPDASAVERTVERLETAGHEVATSTDEPPVRGTVEDPDGIVLRLVVGA